MVETTDKRKQIEEASKLNRRKTADVNSLRETFFFSDWNPLRIRDIIAPIQAGLTHADPEYFCQPPKSDPLGSSMFVLEYVRKGKGYIDCSGETVSVKAGDSYLIKRTYGKRWYADPEEPYEKIWVNITGRYLNSLASVYKMDEDVYVVPISIEPQLEKIIEILMRYDAKEPRLSKLEIMHLILDIFEKINMQRDLEQKKIDRVDFRQILDYIKMNLLYDRLSPEVICSSFFMSHSTLLRLFDKNVGMTPKHYIVLQRIEYAKQLLLGGISVERIANILHFSDSQHFRKVFRQVCGCSPTQWRNDHCAIMPKNTR